MATSYRGAGWRRGTVLALAAAGTAGALATLCGGLNGRTRGGQSAPSPSSAASTSTQSHFTRWVHGLLQDLHSDKHKTYVVGNASADADSIVTAIVLAYLRHVAHPKGGVFMPIIKCGLKDMEMRGDVKIILKDAGIELESLVFLPDDSSGPKLHEAILAGPTILADHNTPDGALLDLVHSTVIEIVDHHADANHFSLGEHAPLRKKNISDAVSCATLVAEELEACDTIRDTLIRHGDTSSISAEDLRTMRKMLLGVILLDSHGLSAKSAATERDVSLARVLSQRTSTDLEAYHTLLDAGRLNEEFWKTATPAQLLAADTKVFTDPSVNQRVAAACVDGVRDLPAYILRGVHSPPLMDVVRAYMEREELQLLRLSSMHDDAVLFVARTNARGRVDVDGLQEDFVRKKMTKKGKRLALVSVVEKDGEYTAILYKKVPDPAWSKVKSLKKQPKKHGKGGRGMFDPRWNNGKSCWHKL